MNPVPKLTLDASFLRNRRILRNVAIGTVVCAAAGLGYGLLAPKWYRSTVVFAPAAPQKPSLSGMLGAAGSPLGAIASGFDPTSADTQRISAVLQSATVTDQVAQQLDLRARYGKETQEAVREAVWKHCTVSPMPKPSLVQLSCEDRDPGFAQQMLARFAEFGNRTFQQVNMGSATEEVTFLQKHVQKLREEADRAATRYREFQEKHQIVDLDTQAKTLVNSIAVLTGQQMAKELELKYAQRYASNDEASMRQLRMQLKVVEEQLRDLEEPRGVQAFEGEKVVAGDTGEARQGIFPPTKSIPRLRAEMETLYRERKVTEATLMFALERLTSARAAQAREASTLVVLDPPTLPTRKSRPRTLTSILIGAVLGFAGMVFVEALRANRANLVRYLRDLTVP